MQFNLSEKEIKNVHLPFVVFGIENWVHTYSLRLSYYRHPTVVFEIPEKSIHIKEFFMDWFYYGFPKNQMISVSSFYGAVKRRKLILNDETYPLFTGKDYTGKMSSCVFIEGTCLEIRHPETQISELVNFLEHMYAVSRPENKPFFKKSFYCNPPGTVFWFEEERMSRLKWAGGKDFDFEDYELDSSGHLDDIQKMLVFVNNRNDYIFVDVSSADTMLRNLRYNFFGETPVFVEKERDENSIIGTLSDVGPILGQFRIKNYYVTVTIPRIDNFITGKTQIMHMLKELRVREFCGDSEIQI